MINQKVKLIAIFKYLADIITVALSFFVAYEVRNYLFASSFGTLLPIEKYFWVLAVSIVLWSLIFYYANLYDPFKNRTLWRNFKKIFAVIFAGVLVIAVVAFVFKQHDLSRSFIGIFGAVSFTSLFLLRVFARLVSGMSQSGYNYRNIIIVGTGGKAKALAKSIDKHSHWGIRVIGFVKDSADLKLTKIGGHDIIGDVSQIPEIIKDMVVDEIFFVMPQKELNQLEDLFLILEEQGINARIVLDLFPHIHAKMYFEEFQGMPLMTFTTIPQDIFQLALKRGFDIIVSLVALIFLSPLFLIIASIIKATSGGGVFFWQERVGLNGRAFTLFKFCSMVPGADEMKKELAHLNEQEGPVFKIEDDPRVTPIGRFIRKTSIDELPQFYNVLRGEMSIVGPRPPVFSEVKEYDRWQRRRFSMKPGITCIWQISGRNKISFRRWMELDLQYIDNWSLWLDIKIFFKTIPVVLFGRGAS